MVNDISSRYRQAQALLQGLLSKRLVLNDAVFPHWISNSDCFWYECEIQIAKESVTALGKEYRLVDAKARNNDIAFDHQSLAKALERVSGQSIDSRNLPICITEITLSPEKVYFKAFDKHWIFESNKLSCQEAKTAPDEGLLSPDGKKFAFVREHNLWVRNLASNEEHALTQDGTMDYPYATAATPFGGPSSPALQAVWSPDSRCLFTHQLDIRQVTTQSIVHHIPSDSDIRPQLFQYQAAYSADKHAETYRLVAIDTDTGNIQAASYERLALCRFGFGFFSLEKFGWWANDSRRAFFVDVTRGAKTVNVVEFDTVTGATRILVKETSDTFVKLSHSILEFPLFKPLPDSDELIWFSERSGWGHIYLYDLKTGSLKHSITEGEWLVRDVLHLDRNRRELLVHTTGRDRAISPYYRDICRVNIDTGDLISLVSGDNDYVVFTSDSSPVQVRSAYDLDIPASGISPSGNYIVTTRSRVDDLPVSLLIDRAGNEILILEIANPFGLPENWQWPEPIKVKSADGKVDLYGVVFRPPGFSPNKSYPVLDFSCGHPGFSYISHAAFINGAFYGAPYLEGAAYAALGFVVVAIEGQGTPYRHKAFQDESYGCMASANAFDDRIAGIRQLAECYPYIDLNRVGIVGCDGITGPVHGLLEHPEFYKVGVMMALEDSRFVPASIAEMFEGINPQPNTTYAEAFAASLQGKLLLVHGMLDTVTPPVATLRLIDALQQANKDFDVLLLPSDGHKISSYMLRRTWDYLVFHLQGVEPPKNFKLTSGYDLLREC